MALANELHSLEQDAGMADSEARIVIRLLNSRILSSDNLRLEDPHVLGVSRSFVYVVARERSPKQKVLLTLARPSEKHALYRLANMRAAIVETRDPRIGAEFGSLRGTLANQPWGCLISTYHDARDKFTTFFSTSRISARAFIALWRDLIEQLYALHSAGYTHGDISPYNILIDSDERPHLIDFELCAPREVAQGKLEVGGTRGYVHPDAESRLANALEGKTEITFDERIQWDLYALGRTLVYALGSGDTDLYRDLGPFRQRYLRLLACRLLDGRNLSRDTAIGLAPEEFKSLRYGSADEALRDLKKIMGEYDLTRIVPELNLGTPDRLQVSQIAPTVLTPRLKRLLGCTEVARLGTFHQLGLLNLVYPTATHTRLEHALGTYTTTCEYVRWLLRDEQNPFFLQVATAEDVKAVLLASLLHDIGHYPLAHDFEEADADVFDHEVRTQSLLLKEDTPLHRILTGPEPDGWAMSPQRICDILRAESAEFKFSLMDRVLHSVVSGPLDADKIDYLTRDSAHLGTRYGSGIDVTRLLRTLTVLLEPAAGHTVGRVGTQEKGKIPAETLAFARYAMFGAVYWHHTYRSIKAMIQWIVWDYLRTQYLKPKTSPSSFRKTVREALYLALDSPSGALFDRDAIEVAVGDSYMPAAESRQLAWCVARAGSDAYTMFDLLSRRRLFKRVAVLSPGRGFADDEWEGLGRFFTARGGSDAWVRRVVLAKALQDLIVTRVREASDNEYGTIIFNENEEKLKFLHLCSKTQAFLVDFPDPGRARQDGLRFVVEEDRLSSRIDTAAPLETRESDFLQRLGQGFTRGIGKVRILVHPDCEEFIKRFLKRETIEEEFQKALVQARSANVSNDAYFVVAHTEGVRRRGKTESRGRSVKG